MSQTQDASDQSRLGALPFVISGISFIPLIGIPFAITSIIWGLSSRKAGARKLAVIGACGALFTVLLYGGLFYFGFVQRGGFYDGLRGKLAQTELNTLIAKIELYKTQFGEYPDSLETLRKTLKEDTFVVYDSTDVHFGAPPRLFFYQRVDQDHYYVRGVGQDGVPFTADDIVPEVNVVGRMGLLTERRSQ